MTTSNEVLLILRLGRSSGVESGAGGVSIIEDCAVLLETAVNNAEEIMPRFVIVLFYREKV